MKINSIIDLVKDLDTSRQTKNLNKLLIRILLHLQVEFSCYKREWLATAPCIIVACVNHNESWHRRADNKDHADIDIAIAVEHLCLAAAEQGLGTCWVCNFDTPRCSEVLGLPENLEPAVLIPVGYAEDEPTEKKRKPLNEILL